MSTNPAAKAADPAEAIKFALEKGPLEAFDFLQCWLEGAWDEIEQAYPEFLRGVGA